MNRFADQWLFTSLALIALAIIICRPNDKYIVLPALGLCLWAMMVKGVRS